MTTKKRKPMAHKPTPKLIGDVWTHLRDRDQRPRPQVTAKLRVVNSEDGGPTRVDLFDEIGFWGITAQDFVDELLAIDAKTIELHINSPGGDVFDGIAIMNALADHSAAVDVVVDGIAASAASFIAMAGDQVKMNRGAQMMIHDASGLCWGNAAEMQAMKDLLDRVSDTIAGLYADRAGGKVEDWRDLMRDETWYSATEAVDAGLADVAVSGPKGADEDEDDEEGSEETEESETEESEETTEEDDDESGAEGGEEDEDDDEDEEEEAPNAKFAAHYSRFKHAGRAQAPAPKTPGAAAVAVDVSKLQAAVKGAFQ